MIFSFATSGSSRQRMSAFTPLSLALLLFLFILSACGSAQSSGQPSAQTKHVLTLVDSPKGDFTSNFNPFINSQTSRYGTQGFVYETLLYINRFDNKVTPWLAESYQQAPDLSSITFTTRQNVKWSDGQPFTSDDVVFTLNAMKTTPSLDTNALWTTTIKDVSAPDANTVKITLLHPSSTALWYIGGQTFIVPKHIFAGVSDLAKYTNDHPVGTGPFVLKSFSPQLFVYAKNPNYWQPGKPAVDEIRLPSLASNTSANLLLSRGDVDWAGVGYDPKLDPIYVDKDPAHNHHWFPTSNIVTLYLNLKKAPFDLLPVRQAISLAINREELQKKAAPYAPPAAPTALLPSQQNYAAPDYTNLQFQVDAAKAESLLQGAGFTKGSDGIYADKSGKKISFKLDVVNGWSDWQSDAQLIASDLKAIGMDVRINTLGDFAPYFTAMQTGSFDATISWTNPGPTPYYIYNAMLASANTAPLNQNATSNWERWQDPTTDKLLQQYATSSDENVQKQAIQGLQKIMVEQLPTIPLTLNPYWDEYTTKHFVGWPSEQNPYALPSPTNYPDNEMVILNLKPAQ